jgi:Putative beta-barrel porin-2, OmpL-like. bbp2
MKPRRRASISTTSATAVGLCVALLGSAALADPAAAPNSSSAQDQTVATAAGAPASPEDALAKAALAAKPAGGAGVNADATTNSSYTVDAVDKAIGTNPFERFIKYYFAEWGQGAAPTDPKAPSSIRDGWSPVPQTAPPMPFTDWPYGGTTMIGDNRTASVDSPLMVAIEHTAVGQAMNDTGIQAYGWIDYGGNISSSKSKFGNAPAGYDFNPNNIQLDQAVIYVERTPDTVQTDHVDWGFRLSAIYGEDYRYTTAYGIASYQLLKHNDFMGYDFPMVYGELWIPKIMDGLMIRVGRFISIPDIEAQLAPNNYMYTHSISYTFDNYTNEGVQTTLAINKQLMLQVGVVMGTEAAVWNYNVKLPNLYVQNGFGPDPLYSGKTFLKDPGATPSLSICGRYHSLDSKTDVNICGDAINHGQWGYNNLQWWGFTAYHTFNKYWHISWETYEEHEDGVPNELNPTALNVYENGGTPFSPQFIQFNPPDLAQCKSAKVLRCQTDSIGSMFYLNYSPNALNNFSLRLEYYDDAEGQRTGVPAIYHDVGLGWQAWLSPQVELRPEFTYYTSSRPSFDLATKTKESVFSGDIIWHF